MNTTLFRQTLDQLKEAMTGTITEQQARRRELREQLIAAASPEHVPEYFCKGGFSDYYRCSCGWISNGYWDLASAAWSDWIAHTKVEMGLTLQRCPCGQTYTPADGETACHQLVDND